MWGLISKAARHCDSHFTCRVFSAPESSLPTSYFRLRHLRRTRLSYTYPHADQDMTGPPPQPGRTVFPATKRRKRSQGPNFLFVKYEDRKTAVTRSQLRSHAMLSSIREKKRHSYSERDHVDQGAGSRRHISDVSTTSGNRNLDRNAVAGTAIWDLAVNRVDPFDVLPMRGADVGEVVRACKLTNAVFTGSANS